MSDHPILKHFDITPHMPAMPTLGFGAPVPVTYKCKHPGCTWELATTPYDMFSDTIQDPANTKDVLRDHLLFDHIYKGKI